MGNEHKLHLRTGVSTIGPKMLQRLPEDMPSHVLRQVTESVTSKEQPTADELETGLQTLFNVQLTCSEWHALAQLDCIWRIYCATPALHRHSENAIAIAQGADALETLEADSADQMSTVTDASTHSQGV